jgi:hypothetical protein
LADRPILFSGPMIRALLDGRKTQTRRVVKDVPDTPAPDCHPLHTPKHPAPYLDAYCGERKTTANPRGMGRNWHWWQVDDRPGHVAFRLPYAPGDRLWVKERWNAFAFSEDGEEAWPTKTIPTGEEMAEIRDEACRVDVRAVYRESDRARQWFGHQKWRPSIHMPRWASRLTLTVTEVRVQRLQEISEDDAIAEGCRPFFDHDNPTERAAPNGTVRKMAPLRGPADDFHRLWDSLNADRAPWDSNPWVVAVSFTVHKGNIDQMEVAA